MEKPPKSWSSKKKRFSKRKVRAAALAFFICLIPHCRPFSRTLRRYGALDENFVPPASTTQSRIAAHQRIRVAATRQIQKRLIAFVPRDRCTSLAPLLSRSSADKQPELRENPSGDNPTFVQSVTLLLPHECSQRIHRSFIRSSGGGFIDKPDFPKSQCWRRDLPRWPRNDLCLYASHSSAEWLALKVFPTPHMSG
jgi:hypothetical protein